MIQLKPRFDVSHMHKCFISGFISKNGFSLCSNRVSPYHIKGAAPKNFPESIAQGNPSLFAPKNHCILQQTNSWWYPRHQHFESLSAPPLKTPTFKFALDPRLFPGGLNGSQSTTREWGPSFSTIGLVKNLKLILISFIDVSRFGWHAKIVVSLE